MNIAPETLLRYLAGDLPAADRAMAEQALAGSAELRDRLARLQLAVATIRDDGSWIVPPSAILAAKGLGRRLESLRPTPLGTRLAEAINVIIARLTFDSRAAGALAGLRGGTGFALAFDCGDVDIDLDCGLGDDDLVHAVGQIHAPQGREFATVNAFGTDLDGPAVASSPISADGMFRLELSPGAYRLQFLPAAAGAAPIELPTVEIP